MNIFLVAGPDAHAVQSIWQTLQHLGVQAANPSRREGLLPQHIHDLMNQALIQPGVNDDGYANPAPSTRILGKIWHELAADLCLGNIGHRFWGWPMADTVQLLDYWLDFDPNTRLVLAYISPIEHLQQLHGVTEITPDLIEQALAQWCQQVESLLARFHDSSPRCLLVHASTAQGQPAQLAQAMRIQWDMHGVAPTTNPASVPSNLSTTYQQALLAQMVSACPAAELLWQELEATANVPNSMRPAQALTPYQHWTQQAKLGTERQSALRQVQEQSKQAKIHEQQALAAAKEIAALQAEKTQLTAALNAATKAKDEQSKQLLSQVEQVQAASTKLAATEVEKAQLATERDAQVKAKIEALAARDAEAKTKLEAIAARDAQAKLAAERLAALDAATKAKEEQSKQLLAQVEQTQLAASEAEKSDIAQENDLLLLQLHQVQEELEHYFLQYQDAAQKHQAQLVDFWQRHPPEVITINLNDDIDGSNWYHAESDGRWAGPELVSTLQMPPVPAGRYMLELHIKDAMQPEIVLGQQILVLGQNSGSAQPIELMHDFAQKGDLYPMVSIGMFEMANQQLPWTLQISQPHNISPADSGGDDTRRLGLKLQTVRLIRQNQTSDLTAGAQP